jgi:adenosylcobinamide-GDP ribazoletransferase
MFTLVPIDVEGEDVMALSKRFYLVVFVGLLLGLLGGVLMFYLTEVYSPLVCAVIIVFLLMGLNRFLHLDGLSDMGDGLMVLGDQERKLTVMKDSHIGAGGMAYGMLFTLLSVAALSGVNRDFYFLAPFTAEIMIKVGMVSCAASGEAKEGMGGIFVRNTNGQSLLIAILLAMVFIVPAWWIMSPDWFSTAGVGWTLIMIVLVTLLAGAYVARTAMRHFGCVNGDILGATNEIVRPLVLLTVTGALWLVDYLHW